MRPTRYYHVFLLLYTPTSKYNYLLIVDRVKRVIGPTSIDYTTAFFWGGNPHHRHPDPIWQTCKGILLSPWLVQKYIQPSAGAAEGQELEARTVIIVWVAICAAVVLE